MLPRCYCISVPSFKIDISARFSFSIAMVCRPHTYSQRRLHSIVTSTRAKRTSGLPCEKGRRLMVRRTHFRRDCRDLRAPKKQRYNYSDPSVSIASVALALTYLPGKQVVFVTNNSTKSRADYKQKLTSMGIPAKTVGPPVPISWTSSNLMRRLG